MLLFHRSPAAAAAVRAREDSAAPAARKMAGRTCRDAIRRGDAVQRATGAYRSAAVGNAEPASGNDARDVAGAAAHYDEHPGAVEFRDATASATCRHPPRFRFARAPVRGAIAFDVGRA